MNPILLLSAFLLLQTSCNNGKTFNNHKHEVAASDSPHPGDTLRGRAVHIVDGDTYDLLVNGNQTVRIRCFGIDAPERGQDFYKKSKQHLGSLLAGDNLTVVITGSAGGNRKAGKTYNRGKRVETDMVSAGMAWHFTRYSQEAELAAAEQQARLAKRGIWSMPDPVAPWDLRKSRRGH